MTVVPQRAKLIRINGTSPEDFKDEFLDNYMHMVSVYDHTNLDEALQKVIDIQKDGWDCELGCMRMVHLYLHDFSDWDRMPVFRNFRNTLTGELVLNPTDEEVWDGTVEMFTTYPCPIIEALFKKIDTLRVCLVHESVRLYQKYGYAYLSRTLWEDWLYKEPITWKFLKTVDIKVGECND